MGIGVVMKKKVKTILFVFIIIGVIVLNITLKNKNEVTKTKRKKQNNLAIMIKEDGATDYTKTSSKDIPKGNYTLNYEKSYCKNNGVIGDYDSSLGKVSFSFVGTDSCFLYFDYKATYLYDTIEQRYNEDKTYLGLYTGEESDTYSNKVYYYKDNVQNNNVLFAGFCWKIVRTTETGGVKLIYNGVQKDVYSSYEKFEKSDYTIISNDATYPYVFDETNKVWKSNNTDDSGAGNENTIEFSPKTDGVYYLNISINNDSGDDYMELYLNDDYIGYGENCGDGCFVLNDSDNVQLNLTSSDVLKIIYYKGSTTTDGTDYVQFNLHKGVGDPVKSCNNTGTDSQIGESAFNSSYTSPAYVGYMYNNVYTYKSKSMSSQSNIVFGSSFTYSGGVYTLTGTKTVGTWSSEYNTINSNHYTLFSTNASQTGATLYYVYYTSSSTAYYIELTGGKSVDDALNEMLYNANTKSSNSSTIKNTIDNWYKNNLDSYTDKLEDTVFCNDRSMSNKTSNGWYPNGGSTRTTLQFKNYSIPTTPSLKCTNENDKFTVDSSNGNGALTYPVGLLTVPEAKLANYGSTNYLNNGQYFWLGSPNGFGNNAGVRMARSEGFTGNSVRDSRGVRPAVSLKPGTNITSGDGSYTLPFLID